MALAGLSLAACVSGGQSTSSMSAQPETEVANKYPVESVMVQILEGFQTQLFTEYRQIPIQIDLETVKTGVANFEGKSVLKSKTTTDFHMAGEYVMTTTYQNFYGLSPLVFYGDIVDDGTYTTAKQLSDIPKQAELGESSAYSQLMTYADSSKQQPVSSTVLIWSLTKATANTAWLCMTAKSEATVFDYDYSGNECYEITPTGDILTVKIESLSSFDEGQSNMQFVSK